MDEPAIFVPPGVVSVVHPTKSASSYDENAEPKSMECEDADWQTDKRNTTTTEEIASWDDICRVCANARDHMIPIFENEGAEHKLINKICMYLPIEVSNTDSLPLKLCYHCAATLLAWHELVTGCLDAEKRLLQMQAERIQRRESCRLRNSQISTSNELAEEIVTAIEESVDEYQTTTTPKSDKPNVSTASLEVPLQERIDQLTSGEKSNSNEGQEAIALSELVDDPEAIATEESHESRVAREETEPRPIHEQEAPCATLQELESTSENVERCAVSRETNERSGGTRQRRFATFRRKRTDGKPAGKSTAAGGESSRRAGRRDSGVAAKKREARVTVKSRSNGGEEARKQSACEKCSRVFVREANFKRHVANCRGKRKSEKATDSPREQNSQQRKDAEEAAADENAGTSRLAEAAEWDEDDEADVWEEREVASKKPTYNNYPCLYCEYTTKRKKLLNQHTNEFHPDASGMKHGISQRSVDRELVRRAKMEANGRVYYHCKDCGKNLFSPYTFTWHVRIHTGERPFTCHLCGKQFRVNQGLARHLRETHAGIKRFPCDLCGRMFSTKRNVEDHRRIHTGERPFVCNVCGKAFKQKASLFVHNRTHSDFFPFKCSYCGQEFRTRPPLVIHLTKHTGEKPHACDICNRAFRIKYELKRHRLIHFDEKPWQCADCGLSFRQKRYLVNHKRINRGCATAKTVEAQGTKSDAAMDDSRDDEDSL